MKSTHLPSFSILFNLLLLPIISICQSGPGGVLNNTNNVFWVKANTGVFNDAGVTLATTGQTVRQWNDQSGNAKHFGQNTAANRPAYTTNVINGFPIVRFDGNNDFLSNLTITTGSTANIFAVVNYASLPNPNPGIFQGSPATLLLSTGANDKAVGMWVSNAGARPSWGRGIQTNNTSCNISQVTGTNTSTNYIFENQYNGTAINQYNNGTISGTVAYNGTLKSWTEFAIGRQGTETWNGDIAEVIAFNTSINLAQRNIVNNYLSSKYNITIAAAVDFYAGDTGGNGNYDFEVGGVGQSSAGNTNTAFNPSVSGGMGLTNVSGMGDGDYILAGHNLLAGNGAIGTDCGGMTGTQNQRWSRIWYIDVTNAGADMATTVNFDMSDGGVTAVPATAANYVLLYRVGTSGNWAESAIVPTIAGDVITFASANLIDGYYTIGTKNASVSPLPIELLSFSAKPCNTEVCLNWSTATEQNNDYFSLEKSLDGVNFEFVNQISTLASNGNSNTTLSYSTLDSNPLSGMNYYRLKQTDKDGTFTYSYVVGVNFSKDRNVKFVVYPNPNSGEFFIDFSSLENNHLIDIELSNAEGKIVFTNSYNLNEINSNQIKINPKSPLVNGIYICTISIEGVNYQVRVVVQ